MSAHSNLNSPINDEACWLLSSSHLSKAEEATSNTGGPRIVQILCSQGIILLRNRTKRGLVLSMQNVLLERLIFKKKWQKTALYWGIHSI